MSGVTSTGALLRLAVRTDRIRLPGWILAFAVITAASAAATAALYPTAGSRIQFAAGVEAVPSLLAMYGHIYDPASLGAVSVLKLTGFGAALAALLMILTAVRHTRAEEEAGRLELLGAGVLGRYAPLASGFGVVAGWSALLGAGTAVGLMLVGLPTAGALAFGGSWAAAGLVFGTLAVTTAQLTRSARAASGTAAAVLAAAFALRAVGDSLGPAWLSWMSPIGWVQQVRPFAGDRWWVLPLPLAGAAVLVVAAAVVARTRDHGAGLLPERPGPARAGRTLRGVGGLAVRLTRASLLVWTSAFLLMGLLVGSIASGIGEFLDNQRAREFIAAFGGTQGVTDAFLAAELAFSGVFASVCAVTVIGRLHSEEQALRVEPLLASPLGRPRLLAGQLLLAGAGSLAGLVAVGAGSGLAHGLHTGRVGAELARLTGAGLAQWPAVVVSLGMAVAVFGLLPRLWALAWVLLAFFGLVGEFGSLLRLPQWILDLSPFSQLPRLPGGMVTGTPLAWLVITGAVLAAAGFIGFWLRDVPA
ncbi:ABC transporter permease [Amycolatopsis sp. NPDC059021]|uniref:ABC transporter permease n=1 Tax=Amycolatopsis sp. NPDC059021 TaxID=3346704 RepID=UPI0036708AA8